MIICLSIDEKARNMECTQEEYALEGVGKEHFNEGTNHCGQFIPVHNHHFIKFD